MIKRKTRKLPRPFLKWAGGKTNLLNQLCSLVPHEYNRYVEPFVGGGALFFALCPPNALLSDSNPELMNCYKVVRDKPDDLLKMLGMLKVDKQTFYTIRKQSPAALQDFERAARLIYLNKTCYNGLYRVNKKGQFNTPFGHHNTVRLCDRECIFAASSALKGVTLMEDDFESTLLRHAQTGDFVYLDPPYPPVGRYSDFKRYTKDFFNEEDHRRLAKAVKEIDKRGCKFVLSNAKHPLISELYSKFRNTDVVAPRYINCHGGKRGGVPELLITNIEQS